MHHEPMMKILLIDDHALFRAGLRMLLSCVMPDAIVLEAATMDEASSLARHNPDLTLCLLDLDLHSEYGLGAIARVREFASETAFAVVSAANDAASVYACLDAGAMSFVPKNTPPDILPVVIAKVLAGEVYLPPELLHTIGRDRKPLLSPRQLDTLEGIARGLSNKSIARELAISEHTVKEYTSAIFQLLDVRNRTEAVIVAARMGLLVKLNRIAPQGMSR